MIANTDRGLLAVVLDRGLPSSVARATISAASTDARLAQLLIFSAFIAKDL
jgi:hypothetical protein